MLRRKRDRGGSGGRRRGRRARRVWLPVLLGSVLVLAVGYLAVERFVLREDEGCSVRAADGGAPVELSLEQADHAATIAAVAAGRRLPERALTIALATAMQESGLRNVQHGDRDSLGLFQQRPSQGWGTARQVQDPVYAGNRFFDRLVKIPGYARLPLTVAAQRVQASGHPQAYAKHEADAARIAAALSGREAAAFTCTVGEAAEAEGGSGSAAAGRKALTAAVRSEFGESAEPPKVTDHGKRLDFAAGGPEAPLAAEDAGDGSGTGSTDPGWALAHWMVAHAKELRVEEVEFAGRRWLRGGSAEGWQRGGRADGTGKVHVTVAAG